jgi:glycosyltransferase involved in cell wall biosynthesis
MPLNVLEAFSLGTPVLANRIGILEEMIDDGIHGFHFDVNDPAGTVATLKKWHNLTKDDKQKISLNCQKAYWDKYSPQKNVILLESIYQEVIKNKTRHE